MANVAGATTPAANSFYYVERVGCLRRNEIKITSTRALCARRVHDTFIRRHRDEEPLEPP